MKRLIKAIFLFLVAVALTSFAVANRHSVRFVVDPFMDRSAATALEAPLYLYLFTALFVGIILGGLGARIGEGKWRKMAQSGKHEAEVWKREADKLKRGLQTSSTSIASGTITSRL